MKFVCLRLVLLAACVGVSLSDCAYAATGGERATNADYLTWERLPDFPDELGVSGAFVGVHNDALIVAGGTNFPEPIWESAKQWHEEIYVLTKERETYRWQAAGSLLRPIGYGAAVSTEFGIVCIGGNDESTTFDEVFLLSWNPDSQECQLTEYPRLPHPCAYGQAAIVDDTIYLAGGQSGLGLDSAMKNFWALDLSKRDDPQNFRWQELEPWPGPERAFNLTVAQHDGFRDGVYVMSGRRDDAGTVKFLRDVWQFTPQTGAWRQRTELPRPMVAGVAAAWGQSHVFVLGGDDGALFGKADELKDDHPGFIKEALAYHTITDTWTSAGAMPQNKVTTVPTSWNGQIVLACGEVRPRVRTPQVWTVKPAQRARGFGAIDYSVLIVYLLAMVGIGVFFARRNQSTDDYFRGGKQIPWWAAGCSIFATMLSSLTYTGIPSKAYAQDWVYALGGFMIPVVAVVAVYVAMPFYRRLDVTSAYEYLEQRFNRAVRLFGSASFALFHVFRMAVVMSLTGLALAVATPLTPAQSVLLMGVLSIIYCTMGGIEAVIWTDTIQAFVLLGGACFAIVMLLNGTDGGFQGAISLANEADKLRIANLHWDATSAQLAIWVVIAGAIGQNLSSYTADQAVIQRYMATPSENLAARSIWINALLSTLATILFFGMGTALYTFYRSHPSKLDPTTTTDQVFPLFIANELPIGIAGLLVAGIFSAAQSTVSTSMNSTATTIVTDFLRPFRLCPNEAAYLRTARLITVVTGTLGTALAIVFTNPNIKSLFDTFIMVIGLFMGVLGGLFILGVSTRRANSFGAVVGAIAGAGTMYALWQWSSVSGYLYTACGIAICVSVGYLASLFAGKPNTHLEGLTVYSS